MKRMQWFNFYLFFNFAISLITHTSTATTSEAPIFRLHLSSEPHTLDPAFQLGSGASYLMNTLQLPLFKSDLNQKFKPSVLESCRWNRKNILRCRMKKPTPRWSNGKEIQNSDVQRTFNYLMNPKVSTLRKDLIQNIKSVTLPNSQELDFNLVSSEPRFQERLTSPLLSPLFSEIFPTPEKGNTLVTSGPYHIQTWETKKKISLTPNPFYDGHSQRPKIEFYFIPEDITAMTLYEQNKIDFLRRVPTSNISIYENKKEFHQAPIVRFDYIGFGPELESFPELRKILTHSLNYDEWGMLLKARGRPGCFGIGLDLLKADPCYKLESPQLNEWKSTIQKTKIPNLELHYSTLGGEDSKRSMEWVQSEWKKNLDLLVKVKGVENAYLQKELHEKAPPLFRLGVSLEHLSCSNALNAMFFLPQQKFPFQTPSLILKVKKLQNLSLKDSIEDSLCFEILTQLLNENWIIPLGRIQISYLLKPQWEGIKLTELNFLDVSQLHPIR